MGLNQFVMNSLTFLIILTLIVVLSNSVCGCITTTNEGVDNEGDDYSAGSYEPPCNNPSGLQRQVETNVKNGVPTTGTPTVIFNANINNQEITFYPGEFEVDAQGNINANQLSLSESDARFESVEGFSAYTPTPYQPIFTARKAKRLEYLGMTVINARDIVGYKDSVRIGSGDIVQTDVATLSNVTGLEETVRTISFDSVDAMYVDKIILLGLGNSSFVINQDGVLVDSRITSRLDNNTLDLKGLFVTLDAGETVRFQDNGTLHAMSEDNVTFQFYDERVIGAAELWTEGVNIRCVRLAQFASSSNF